MYIEKGKFTPIDVRGKLQILTNRAEAGQSGRQVGVVLSFSNGRQAVGWNTEALRDRTLTRDHRLPAPETMHAERRALRSAPPDSSLRSIDLMIRTEGQMGDIKYALPCHSCTDALSPYTTPDTQVTLHVAGYEKRVTQPFGKLKEAYKPFSDVPGPAGEGVTAIDNFLGEHTPLTAVDRNVVALMADAIRNADETAALYLTGTSSGRSGPRGIIVPSIIGSPYLDIDLLLTSQEDDDWGKIFAMEDLYNWALTEVGFKHGRVRHQGKPSYRLLMGEESAESGFRIEYFTYETFDDFHVGRLLKDPEVPSALDFSFGESVEKSMTDQYQKENRYIRII